MYRSMWSLFVACALAALLSAGCREARSTPRRETGAAPSATRATGRANQEVPTHTMTSARHLIPTTRKASGSVRLGEPQPARRRSNHPDLEQCSKSRASSKPSPIAWPSSPAPAARIEKVYVNAGESVTQGARLVDLRSTEAEKLQVELLRAAKVSAFWSSPMRGPKSSPKKPSSQKLEHLQQELIKPTGPSK